ncbi:hypothetical protein L204_105289 [Cryptococcus depauperatus]
MTNRRKQFVINSSQKREYPQQQQPPRLGQPGPSTYQMDNCELRKKDAPAIPEPSLEQYSISLAVRSGTNLSLREEKEIYSKGKELLINSLQNGLTKRVIPIRKREQKTRGKDRQDMKIIWHTAGLSFPCLCSFQSSQLSYTLTRPPPILADLSTFYSLPMITPKIGNQLPHWFEDFEADTEPPFSSLEEFEAEWSTPPRTMPESRCSKLSFMALQSIASSVSPLSSLEVTKRHKKWWRAQIQNDPGYGLIWSFLLPPYTKSLSSTVAPKNGLSGTYHDQENFILPSCSKVYPNPYHPDLHHYARINPEGRVYWLVPVHGPVLIRGVNHPLDEKKTVMVPLQPSAAILSSCESDQVSDLATSSSKMDASVPATISQQPKALSWTPERLKWFITHWVKYCTNSCFGCSSFAFSGPKPDPFLDLALPPPLTVHQYLPSNSPYDVKGQPVRVECGDHLRLYCSAKYALQFKSFLNKVWVPKDFNALVKWQVNKNGCQKNRKGEQQEDNVLDIVSMRVKVERQPGEQHESKSKRQERTEQDWVVDEDKVEKYYIFRDTRLTLVGGREEVLVVA